MLRTNKGEGGGVSAGYRVTRKSELIDEYVRFNQVQLQLAL